MPSASLEESSLVANTLLTEPRGSVILCTNAIEPGRVSQRFIDEIREALFPAKQSEEAVMGRTLGTGFDLREIMADVAPLVGMGMIVGLLFGAAAARAFRSLLHEVSLVDPGSLLVAAVVLAGAACLATYLPAREVAKIDPARTLHRGT